MRTGRRKGLRRTVVGCVLAVAAALGTSAAAPESLDVLPEKLDGLAPAQHGAEALKAQAVAASDRRDAAYEQLKTPEQLAAYQKRMREFFLEKLGGFPERTPLNARTTGTLQRDGYRIEKVIYESRPGFHVSALLYLPDTPPPYPGVLFPCGHSENGKAVETYQRGCILLAKNGLAVLCFDPVGQGERKQILDASGKARFRSTSEHNAVSPAQILLGTSLARTMIWDGIRGIDYLVSRKEIDPERIGCTGNSGGGTQTSYLMALDDRIKVAAPSCYLTTFRRLLETIGPQDMEQNIHGQVAFGMDHPDYVLMRAPKPTLYCVATRDFFDIGGAWANFRQGKRFYTRLGFPERVDLAETDATHGFSTQLRVAATRWMRRWLLGKDDAITETETPIQTDAELQCTPKGQVLLLPGARTLFDLAVEEEKPLAEARRRDWASRPRSELLAQVRETAGIRPLAALPRLRPDRVGALERSGFRVEKLIMRGEPGTVLPALLFTPPAPKGEPVLYVHGMGKREVSDPGGPVERLVREGRTVLAVDLRGLGEFQPRNSRGEPGSHPDPAAATAYLLGRSYLGLRAEEVLQCARWLRDNPQREGQSREVRLVATGEAVPAALHAAALEPALITGAALEGGLRSWTDLVRAPSERDQLPHAVHGALRVYDLADLARIVEGQGK